MARRTVVKFPIPRLRRIGSFGSLAFFGLLSLRTLLDAFIEGTARQRDDILLLASPLVSPINGGGRSLSGGLKMRVGNANVPFFYLCLDDGDRAILR